MLEVVDAERDRLAERHRAEVAGELQPALVRRLDGGAERLAADVGVGLEPRHAFVGPVVDDAPRLFGRADLGHRRRPAGTGQVGSGEVHARPGNCAAIDRLLHVDLVIGRGAAGRADRGDAAAPR